MKNVNVCTALLISGEKRGNSKKTRDVNTAYFEISVSFG